MAADDLSSSPKFKTYAAGGALGANADVTTDLGQFGRAFRVGVAGDVVVEFWDGTTDTVYSVQIGERIEAQIKRIMQTGTTAQKITVFK
jgi:hypothetical protein